MTDQEYPLRPAFSLLTKVLDEFSAKVPQTSFTSPSSISFPEINAYVEKYQDPRQADTIMRVQQELDETKIVLVSLFFISNPNVDRSDTLFVQHKTIESVLQRGEKLDSLVERSNALSMQSKMFYKTAKKVPYIPLFFIRSIDANAIPNQSKILAASLCEYPHPIGSTYSKHNHPSRLHAHRTCLDL